MPADNQSSFTRQSQKPKIIRQTVGKVLLGKKINQIDDLTKLDLALEAIEYAENQKTVVAPTVLKQLAAKPTYSQAVMPTVGGKERTGAATLDGSAVETGLGQQVVEFEKTPEISPEVAEYVQRVEDHADQLSEPIVVDGQSSPTTQHHQPTQPVVVLPITEAEEKMARFKSLKYSIKWLVEWSHKIVKKFVGRVIYKMA